MANTEREDDRKSILPFDWNLQAVSAWLETLTEAGTGGGSREIYATLCKLNLHPAQGDGKLPILEKLRPAVFFQSEQLKSSFLLDASGALDPKIRKIAKLSIQLHRELAAGYRQITKQSVFLKHFSPENQAWVIHRALQSLGMSLLRSAQAYALPSSKIWKEINSLYLLAEKLGVTAVLVAENFVPFNRKSTVVDSLKRSALFTLANPYCLTPAAMQSLFTLLEQHGYLTAFEQKPVRANEEAVFFVDPGTPFPPKSVGYKADRASEKYLFIGRLPEQLNRVASNDLDSKTLVKILRNLGVPEENSRIATTIEFLVPGCEKLTAFLVFERQRRKIGDPKLLGSHWNPVFALELRPLDHEKSIINAAREAAVRSRSRSDPLKPCRTSLSGEKGYGVVEIKTDEFGVGEVVGLKNEQALRIGILRWMQRLPDTGWKRFGIEFIEGDAALVSVRFDSGASVDGILVGEENETNAHPTLLLSPGKYPIEAHMIRDAYSPEEKIVLAHLEELSPFFHRYRLAPSVPR